MKIDSGILETQHGDFIVVDEIASICLNPIKASFETNWISVRLRGGGEIEVCDSVDRDEMVKQREWLRSQLEGVCHGSQGRG
jgi:hypothetical protein